MYRDRSNPFLCALSVIHRPGMYCGAAPLYAIEPVNHTISDVSTGTWLLTEDLYVQDGITLQVYGRSRSRFSLHKPNDACP